MFVSAITGKSYLEKMLAIISSGFGYLEEGELSLKQEQGIFFKRLINNNVVIVFRASYVIDRSVIHPSFDKLH